MKSDTVVFCFPFFLKEIKILIFCIEYIKIAFWFIFQKYVIMIFSIIFCLLRKRTLHANIIWTISQYFSVFLQMFPFMQWSQFVFTRVSNISFIIALLSFFKYYILFLYKSYFCVLSLINLFKYFKGAFKIIILLF